MVRPARHTFRPDTDPPANAVVVTGRHRLPSDVLGELVDVLAHEPRVVLCDLTGMAAAGSALAMTFQPLATYLTAWPGTLVVMCTPDPAARADLLSAGLGERLVVRESRESWETQTHPPLPDVQCAMTDLPPVAAASGDARAFATRTLVEWGLPELAGSTALVVSELVTNSVVHAVTVLDLTLSRVGSRLRVAVHDYGGGWPASRRDDMPEQPLNGRGLLLVQALTESWGVFSARSRGKTVWAVLDRTSALV